MLLLAASDINKYYGVKPVIKQVCFSVQKGERIGIVGPNGAGKSTLFSIIAGELPADSGRIYVAPETVTGFLKQQNDLSSGLTVYGEMLEIFAPLLQQEKELTLLSEEIAGLAGRSGDHSVLLRRYADLTTRYEQQGGYRFRSDIRGMLAHLAFPESWYERPVAELSGGERTRLALAGLLLRKPSLLLLDEPTNHLDIGMLTWLEQYLRGYPGTILLISHDRYFLDQTADRIFEIERHHLSDYTGNYSVYRRLKVDREDAERHHYQAHLREIQRQEDMIRRFRQHGTEKLAKRARSRERRLEQAEVPVAPETVRKMPRVRFRERFASGTDVIRAENLAKAFPTALGSRKLFENLNFDIKRGERVCLVGANGSGKTTLLKILIGELPPDAGRVVVGHNVDIGYYDQEQRNLSATHTVLEELHQAFRLYSETEIRSWLGRFLFSGDDVYKAVSDLSGGEKARLALLKLLLTGANFMVMDEPTNHLDLAARDSFENALADYPGTLLVVSHDRYFLNQIATRIVELSDLGLTTYAGGYDYYTEKRQALATSGDYPSTLAGRADSETAEAESADRESARQRKLSERQQSKADEARLRRQNREIAALEQTIADWESRIIELEQMLGLPEISSDYEALARYAAELDAAKKHLDAAYEQWLERH